MIGDNSFLPKNKETIEKKEVPMQTTEVVSVYTPQYLSAILEIDKESFEEQYEDVEEYYRKALENQENINVFFKDGEKLVGYLLAIPHSAAYEEMKKDDPEMKDDSKRFYIETCAVLPEYRKGTGFLRMMHKVIEEAERRGINKFSMHARVENGLSETLQKYFGKMFTTVRRIENWPYYYNGEPTDYLEGTYEKK